MRDLGNTLIVVEHDTDTMLAADYLVDVGPKAGDEGGYIVASGTPQEVMMNDNSITGRYLSGKEKIEVLILEEREMENILKLLVLVRII